MTASTLSGNTAAGNGGAVFADGSTLNFTNDTFVDNISQKGLGGSIVLYGNGGALQNVTFEGNQASGGVGGFFAADAGGSTPRNSKKLVFHHKNKESSSPLGRG